MSLRQACALADVVNVIYRLQHPARAPLVDTKASVVLQLGADCPCKPRLQEYQKLKDAVLECEQMLLRILAYRLNVLHPHHFVLHFIKELEGGNRCCVVLHPFSTCTVVQAQRSWRPWHGTS